VQGDVDMTDNGVGLWLWVDPAREAGYRAKEFDQAAFLARAVALFRSKEQWGGQLPNAVRAHPSLVENGLKPIAEKLGLRVKSDPIVAPGTYRLGVVRVERG
jgi:hypothetical protein